jgi:2-oxoglutarate dehydrogenase E2 component (dihydrolipoamide succinyltransferase)
MIEVTIPPLGESVSQGIIVSWLKKDGDLVHADESLLELETDKASVEIPAPAAGRLEIVQPEGAEVSVGTVVARIVEGKGAAATAASKQAGAAEGTGAGVSLKEAQQGPLLERTGAVATLTAAAPAATLGVGAGSAGVPTATAARVALRSVSGAVAAKTVPPVAADAEPQLSPAVRRLVAERQLDPRQIPASGKGGRLTKGDVLAYLEKLSKAEAGRAAGAAPAAAGGGGSPPGAPAARAPERAPRGVVEREAPGDVERVRMTLLRRRIAERLVEAQRAAAILTTFNEIDMTAVTDLRRRYKARFQEVHGVGLGLMSLFGRAVVQALRDVPVVNAQIDGDEIVYFKRVHLGIAVGTARGLVVPVVRNADGMTLAQLERAIAELAELARAGKLMPDHLAGGTFTISNGGVYGSLLSTPILNPPQSGILGMHKIEERPVAVGGQVLIRPMMYVALSYDHRLVDGEQAVTFLVRVKERLEDPARLLLEL